MGSRTLKPIQIRRCTECKRTFVGAESFRQHKHIGMGCRSDESLKVIGFIRTTKGYKHTYQRASELKEQRSG